MGLIRKAAEQGRQAIDAIAQARRAASTSLDVVIVGCGPAGLAGRASAHRAQAALRADRAGSVARRRGLPLPAQQDRDDARRSSCRSSARCASARCSKEKLLEFWHGVVAQDRACRSRSASAWSASSATATASSCAPTAGSYRARSVLLAIGRRGTPRKLDVPGEESPKVVYRLVDPAQYGGQAVLVVGGGDSALEGRHRAGRATRHRGDAVLPQRGLLARQAEKPPARWSRRSEQAAARRTRIHRRRDRARAVQPEDDGRRDSAAQRRRHRLRRRAAADTAAAEDRHPVRHQARQCLNGAHPHRTSRVESATGPANSVARYFFGRTAMEIFDYDNILLLPRKCRVQQPRRVRPRRSNSAAGASSCRWCRPT